MTSGFVKWFCSTDVNAMITSSKLYECQLIADKISTILLFFLLVVSVAIILFLFWPRKQEAKKA